MPCGSRDARPRAPSVELSDQRTTDGTTTRVRRPLRSASAALPRHLDALQAHDSTERRRGEHAGAASASSLRSSTASEFLLTQGRVVDRPLGALRTVARMGETEPQQRRWRSLRRWRRRRWWPAWRRWRRRRWCRWHATVGCAFTAAALLCRGVGGRLTARTRPTPHSAAAVASAGLVFLRRNALRHELPSSVPRCPRRHRSPAARSLLHERRRREAQRGGALAMGSQLAPDVVAGGCSAGARRRHALHRVAPPRPAPVGKRTTGRGLRRGRRRRRWRVTPAMRPRRGRLADRGRLGAAVSRGLLRAAAPWSSPAAGAAANWRWRRAARPLPPPHAAAREGFFSGLRALAAVCLVLLVRTEVTPRRDGLLGRCWPRAGGGHVFSGGPQSSLARGAAQRRAAGHPGDLSRAAAPRRPTRGGRRPARRAGASRARSQPSARARSGGRMPPRHAQAEANAAPRRPPSRRWPCGGVVAAHGQQRRVVDPPSRRQVRHARRAG